MSKKHTTKKLKSISFQDRATEFLDDMYCDGKVLFCKYCQHSIIDHVRIHTIKLHLQSTKHQTNKESALQ